MSVAFCSVPSDKLYDAFNFEQIAVAAASTPLSASVYDPASGAGGASTGQVKARAALMTLDGANPIHWRIDGGTPTTAIGHNLAAGEHLLILGIANIKRFRFIGTVAAGNNLNITYLR